eukprot:TRINITY_DN7395_c0_g1_i13.p1 TRINITY_DN7395_c0_g1~~TRINITY_DN7395_c0_g1_i13.p1  ORF type:complete len:125 (-),score=9.79 TRINITY_DN7395_c0_g1_i13:35-409(-)
MRESNEVKCLCLLVDARTAASLGILWDILSATVVYLYFLGQGLLPYIFSAFMIAVFVLVCTALYRSELTWFLKIYVIIRVLLDLYLVIQGIIIIIYWCSKLGEDCYDACPVSYTHLTLPTIYSV